MTAQLRQRQPIRDVARLPAGVPPEPEAEAILRILIEALANASAIVEHGNGFALVVPIAPDLFDLIAAAGAEDEDGDEDRCSADDHGPPDVSADWSVHGPGDYADAEAEPDEHKHAPPIPGGDEILFE